MTVAGREVTAAVLIIGNEILSGRTKDVNLGFLAEQLTGLGIRLREARVIADLESDIVATVNETRARYDYVFTTGGIGPTHDDITADSVAKAFGVAIDYHPQAVALMKAHFAARGTDMNEARMRMARMPAGAELVLNRISAAPGFRIENVIVLAGVPAIMQAMLDAVAPQLKTGTKVVSDTVRADCREGDIGTELGNIAKAWPELTIGSYPFVDEATGVPNTNLVVRGRDPAQVAAAMADVRTMLGEVRARLTALRS